MTRTEFKELLIQHQLTVNTFLDLRDIWNQLSAHDRYELLKEDSTINTPGELYLNSYQGNQ